MGDRRVGALLAPDHRGVPRLVPEAVELHRLGHGGDRMHGAALDRPGAHRRIEVLEQAVLEILPRRPAGQLGVDRGRALDDVGQRLAVHQRQRIGEHHARHALAGKLGRARHHHAAGAGAGQHDILQVLVEQEVRDLLGVALGGDAGAHLALALGAAVERRREHAMALGQQLLDGRLPNPAALVGAVDQDERGHLLSPFTVTPAICSKIFTTAEPSCLLSPCARAIW